MAGTAKHEGLEGWVVESQRSHYTLGYWISFMLGMLGQIVPAPPRITYVVQSLSTGEQRTIALPGDHGPKELAEAIARA